MNIIKENEKYVLGIIQKLGYDYDDVHIEVSSRKELGQFQINDAFTIAKKYHENPREVAQKIDLQMLISLDLVLLI